MAYMVAPVKVCKVCCVKFGLRRWWPPRVSFGLSKTVILQLVALQGSTAWKLMILVPLPG